MTTNGDKPDEIIEMEHGEVYAIAQPSQRQAQFYVRANFCPLCRQPLIFNWENPAENKVIEHVKCETCVNIYRRYEFGVN